MARYDLQTPPRVAHASRLGQKLCVVMGLEHTKNLDQARGGRYFEK